MDGEKFSDHRRRHALEDEGELSIVLHFRIRGLRSKKGNRVVTQQLHRIIQNPFYYGVMRIKGKYVYLICRDPSNPNQKLWIKEKDVIEQIEQVLKDIQVPKAYLPELIDYINTVHEAEKHYHHQSIETLNDEIQQLNLQIDRLTDLLIADSITKEAYDRKFSQLKQKRKELSAQQEEHQSGNEEFKTALVPLLSLASKAPEIFRSSEIPVKRSLVAFVFSNLVPYGIRTRVAAVKEFFQFHK